MSIASNEGDINREYKVVPIEKIKPIEGNIRKMTDEEFNLLCKSIEENGFVEPIQVVEYEEDGGYYRIVNGQHRFEALRDVFGVKEIPVVVVGKNWDDTRYWMEVIRLNNIKGDFDPVLLTKKVLEIREKTKNLYDLDELKRKLGFAGAKTKFDKIFEDVKKSLPPEMRKKLESSKKEIETVEDLSRVISEIMRRHGKTVDKNYLIFTFGGKDHLMVRCDSELWSKISMIKDMVEERGLNMAGVFNKIFDIGHVVEVIGDEEGEDIEEEMFDEFEITNR